MPPPLLFPTQPTPPPMGHAGSASFARSKEAPPQILRRPDTSGLLRMTGTQGRRRGLAPLHSPFFSSLLEVAANRGCVRLPDARPFNLAGEGGDLLRVLDQISLDAAGHVHTPGRGDIDGQTDVLRGEAAG